jgi:hypothetical protein
MSLCVARHEAADNVQIGLVLILERPCATSPATWQSVSSRKYPLKMMMSYAIDLEDEKVLTTYN